MTAEWHGPLPDSHFMVGRNGIVPDRIVLHTMCCWIGVADSIFKGTARQAGAHYGIRLYDVPPWQWVSEDDTAYHAGDEVGGPAEPISEENIMSIGIEHEDAGNYNDPRPDVLYARSAALVADVCRRRGIPCVRGTIVNGESASPGIYDHRQLSPTGCPDALDTDRIIREAAAIIAATPTAAYPVLGAPPSNLVTYALKVNPAIDPMIPGLYDALARQVGIVPEVAFAQALHETANFTFPGIARPEWHNPAGIGVTGAPGVGNQFPDWESGVRAHLGHLLWYFGAVHPVAGFCDHDPRHFGAHKKYPNDMRQLNGHWAVPGTNYGESIYEIVRASQSK